MRIAKTIGKLHLWLGLASGILVFFTSVTGCIFVFEEELFGFFHSGIVVVEERPGLAAKPLSELRTAAQAALGSDVPISGITIPNNPRKAYVFSSFKADAKRKGWFYDAAYVRWKNAYVDPYSGKVIGVLDMRHEFFVLIRQLHQNLGLRHQIGSPIVGTAVLIFLFLLISGLVLWWPRKWAAAKTRVAIKWNSSWRRRIYDLHNVLGFYVLGVALIIVVTGLAWSFEWWRSGMLAMMGSGKPGFSAPAPWVRGEPSNHPLDVALEESLAKRPSAKKINFFNIDNDSVFRAYIPYRGGTAWNEADYRYFDARSGKEYARILHEEKTLGMKWTNSNYDIHVGKALGLPGQILAFFASLTCASLPVTGFLMWLGKRKRKNPPKGNGVPPRKSGPERVPHTRTLELNPASQKN
jgi:uncharacterized iron-regulated membrane protein